MSWEQLAALILLPIALAAAHGYFTNWMAVTLLLKPVRPVNILGFRLQGLLPRRQADLAERVSEAIAGRFLTREDVLNFIRQADPVASMRALLVQKWDEKLGEMLEDLPLIKALIPLERIAGLRDRLADALSSDADAYTERLVESLEGKIDLKSALKRNILAFDVAELNAIIEQIGRREFREIAWVGAAIGLAIGSIHAAVNFLLLR